MKTVLYCNVHTGEVFDDSGTLRSNNNPFAIAYGESRIFVWHLVTASNPSQTPSQWPALSIWETTPTAMNLTVDDSYQLAYRGVLKESVTGTVTSLAVSTTAESSEILPSGSIRLSNGTATRTIQYTAREQVSGGYTLTVNADLGTTVFAADSAADFLKEPLAKQSTLLADLSNTASGIFAFKLSFHTRRLKELLEYSDTTQIVPKGLELSLSGVSGNNTEEILRVTAPVVINGILTLPDAPAPDTSAALAAYQSWTLGLFTSAIETSLGDGNGNWGVSEASATCFRFRFSGVQGMSWSQAIPLPHPVEYTFTIASGSTLTEKEILYSAMGYTSGLKKPLSLYQVQADDSELDITHLSCVQIYRTDTKIKIQWNGIIPAGSYVLRG